MTQQIAVIGECMVEVSPDPKTKFSGPAMAANIRYGGDTLNTAVYLARQGVSVDYVTALGNDPVSDWMLGEWLAEGIGCDLVQRVDGAVPGLYLIDLDPSGERSFYYWREQAPARRLFDAPELAAQLLQALRQSPYLYLSGITLALYNPEVLGRLFEFFDDYRAQGGKVLFDNNYRPRQWVTQGEAQSVFEQMYRRTDIALPTIDDELLLFGAGDAAGVISRLQGAGVREIVLKQGADGCLVATPEGIHETPAAHVEQVIDTTAAGDSFNAGYIAARLEGLEPPAAAAQGNALAARVVQHSGAIIPRDH